MNGWRNPGGAPERIGDPLVTDDRPQQLPGSANTDTIGVDPKSLALAATARFESELHELQGAAKFR